MTSSKVFMVNRFFYLIKAIEAPLLPIWYVVAITITRIMERCFVFYPLKIFADMDYDV